MTTMLERVNKLAGEIGARPAGTDEEQKAAFYVEGVLKHETNCEVEMQEFNCFANPEILRAICSFVVFLSSIFAIFMPSFAIYCLIISFVGALFFILNEANVISFSKFPGKIPTQNVIAKYSPDVQSERSKKTIIVTNYDTSKIRKEEASSLFLHLGKFKLFEVFALGVSVLANLLIVILGKNSFFTFLLVVGILGSFIAMVSFVLHMTSKYNAGANNNAASVAVMLEVAKNIDTFGFNHANEKPVIHGRDVALDAGVIPEGVNVSWEGENSDVQQQINPAVANMFYNKQKNADEGEQSYEASKNDEASGQRNFENLESSEKEQLENRIGNEPNADYSQQSFQVSNTVSSGQDSTQEASIDAPDWFKRGIEKATGKGNAKEVEVKKSTYGEVVLRGQNEQAENPNMQVEQNELQKKLRAIHEQIEGTTKKNSQSESKTEIVQEEEQIKQEEDPINKFDSKKGVTGYLSSVTKANDFEESKNQMEAAPHQSPEAVDSKNSSYSERRSAELKDEIPALKPLEPEYGVEIDKEDFLDNSETKPMHAVIENREVQKNEEVKKTEENSVKQSDLSVKEVATEKRQIVLPSLTGALEANKLNKKLEEKRKETQTQPEKIKNETGKHAEVSLPSLDNSKDELNRNKKENKTVSAVGAFGVGEATGTFAPITDEDLRRANEGADDMYVYDVDETELKEGATESGAVAGPGYVDIPETHTESIFGKLFHKKKKTREKSLSSEIGVDENWDARKAGKERGDWSSFLDDDDWNGGATTLMSDEKGVFGEIDAQQEILDFARGSIDKEVWFVALGASCSSMAGINAFIESYREEIKGARFIIIDSMGAGNLAVIEREGVIRTQSSHGRMKRYARSTARNTGISVSSEKMLWKNSIASSITKQGYKFLHLARFEGGKPAFLSQQDDTVEAVDEETLNESSQFLSELLRAM